MKCDYCGHRLCCCPITFCPLTIIGPGPVFGPGVREDSKSYKEAEAKRRKEFQDDLEKRLESFFKRLEKERPEVFKKITENKVKHKKRYNIVEEQVNSE